LDVRNLFPVLKDMLLLPTRCFHSLSTTTTAIFLIMISSYVDTVRGIIVQYGRACDLIPFSSSTTFFESNYSSSLLNTSYHHISSPIRFCDTSKRLSCDSKAQVCRCHREDHDIFDRQSGRCETRIGRLCVPDPAEESSGFPIICAHTAICNKTTNFCECPNGYTSTTSEDECRVDSNIFLNSLAMFLLLISVFVCT